MSAEYFVKTEQFEGPLDLLLHLIRVHEIDIFAIDVLLLAQEYLSYLLAPHAFRGPAAGR